MSKKKQHTDILIAIAGFVAVVLVVAVIGFFALDRVPDEIQGEVEVTEYRVSSKVPSRVLELRVKEGDYVHVGDTLAILDAPDVMAKKQQAQGAVRKSRAQRRFEQAQTKGKGKGAGKDKGNSRDKGKKRKNDDFQPKGKKKKGDWRQFFDAT